MTRCQVKFIRTQYMQLINMTSEARVYSLRDCIRPPVKFNYTCLIKLYLHYEFSYLITPGDKRKNVITFPKFVFSLRSDSKTFYQSLLDIYQVILLTCRQTNKSTNKQTVILKIFPNLNLNCEYRQRSAYWQFFYTIEEACMN